MINQELEALKEKLGVVKYTFVRTLDDYDCQGPIDYFVDNKSINSIPKEGCSKRYVFSFKRRYHVPAEEDVPSEYGVICFNWYPEEENQVYYLFPSCKEDIIEGIKGGMVGRANMLDETNRVTILIGYVLKKIKSSNFL